MQQGAWLAWRAVQEDSGAAAQALAEELRVAQWQIHSLQDGRLHILQAAHILPLHVGDLPAPWPGSQMPGPQMPH